MSGENSSQQSQQSRYKSIESQQDTRNPTTNKKYHGTPTHFKRSNHHMASFKSPKTHNQSNKKGQSLRYSLLQIEVQKQRYIHNQQYSKAERMDKQLRRVKSEMAKNHIDSLISEQKMEKMKIKQAHLKQLAYLHRVWNQYFAKIDQRVEHIRESFQEYQKQQIYNAQQRLKKKCQTLRNKSVGVIELERKEELLIKLGNFKELSFIHKQKKKIINQEINLRLQKIKQWTNYEEQQLRIQQSKRYSILMSRLNENRKDKQIVYNRQQKRLKQKYKNVIVQMKHEQNMKLHQMHRLLDCVL